MVLVFQADDRAYAYQVFDDGLVFKEFRYDDPGVFLESGERNLVVYRTGDGFLACFQGDHVVGVGQRSIAGFFHMINGEGEHAVFGFCFQKGTVTYPGTSAANSGV